MKIAFKLWTRLRCDAASSIPTTSYHQYFTPERLKRFSFTLVGGIQTKPDDAWVIRLAFRKSRSNNYREDRLEGTQKKEVGPAPGRVQVQLQVQVAVRVPKSDNEPDFTFTASHRDRYDHTKVSLTVTDNAAAFQDVSPF